MINRKNVETLGIIRALWVSLVIGLFTIVIQNDFGNIAEAIRTNITNIGISTALLAIVVHKLPSKLSTLIGIIISTGGGIMLVLSPILELTVSITIFKITWSVAGVFLMIGFQSMNKTLMGMQTIKEAKQYSATIRVVGAVASVIGVNLGPLLVHCNILTHQSIYVVSGILIVFQAIIDIIALKYYVHD